jgi:hypothetical protein
MNSHYLKFIACFFFLAGNGCSSPQGSYSTSTPVSESSPVPDKQAPPLSSSIPDMSGDWEKNYQLSDNFDSRIELYISDIQRSFYAPRGSEAQAAIGRLNNQSISALARFTEELTRMPILTITQNAGGISIERELDFTLRCLHGDRQLVRTKSPFGNDVCGWDRNRLLFTMKLQGGLSINHLFSLSADGNMLDVTTTVSSDSVPAPMTIRNLYQRYQRPAEDFSCTLTLTRSRVCSRRGVPLK